MGGKGPPPVPESRPRTVEVGLRRKPDRDAAAKGAKARERVEGLGTAETTMRRDRLVFQKITFRLSPCHDVIVNPSSV